MKNLNTFENFSNAPRKENNFSNTIKIILEHWPIETDDNDLLVRKIANVCAASSYREKEIIELCELICDLCDKTNIKGNEV